MPTLDAPDPRWSHLLRWLASKSIDLKNLPLAFAQDDAKGGGLYATRDIYAQELLFKLPASCLVNKKSLASDFVENLSATQMIALYLAQHRHSPPEKHRAWFPIIPAHFDGMPLWWTQSEPALATQARRILSYAPDASQKLFDQVEERFVLDWTAVSGLSPYLTKPDFLWAWCCINSRCLYHPLGFKSDKDNFTLAPLVELANHDPSSPCLFLPSGRDLCFYASLPDHLPSSRLDARTRSMPRPILPKGTIAVRKGDEVCLPYGQHDSATLLAEYGFVVPGNAADAFDLTRGVEALFGTLATDERVRKLELLQAHGYAGPFTLMPRSREPSWPLLVALRLYHLPLGQHQRWINLVSGLTDTISPANEALVINTIDQLHQEDSDERQKRSKQLQDAVAEVDARLQPLAASVQTLLKG